MISNVYSDKIHPDSFIGPFCEVQKGASIGRKTRIQSHTFICDGVNIGENCFVGHGVMFTNDMFDWEDNKGKIWNKRKTIVKNNVKIGNNATILPVEIGENSIIGAGSVVTKNVPANCVVAGNPAKILRWLKK